MKLSLQWLKSLVDWPVTPKELGLRLTMATAEIEGLEPHGSDLIIDIDNKSLTHRPDLWGHYGFAREISALYHTPLAPLPVAELALGSTHQPEESLTIELQDTEWCRRYNALIIENVKVEPSPEWLQRRLEAVGARPINNIVDLTNYILFEMGQPLHAFDRSKLLGDKIIIRRATEGETIATLDGKTHTLTTEMLLIADAQRGAAIAGVMGGALTEVDDTTTTLVLESANFHPGNVRKTAAKLGIRTESSMRFEKSLDPRQTSQGIARFLYLLQEICPGATAKGPIYQAGITQLPSVTIQTSTTFINRKLGTTLPNSEITGILRSLQFAVQENGEQLTVGVPSWRATGDIGIPEDLVEEVGRVYGYDNITPIAPLVPLAPVQPSPLHELTHQLRQTLSRDLGFTEVYNYAFVGEKLLEKVGESLFNHLELANPLASEHHLMRTSLVPNMLKITAENLRYYKSFNLYELDRVFSSIPKPLTDMTFEHFEVCGLICRPLNTPDPYLEAKGLLASLQSKLPVQLNLAYQPTTTELPPWAHPGRTAALVSQGKTLGWLAELHPMVAERFNISAKVEIFVLDVSAMLKLPVAGYHFTGVNRYPTVPFDISLICPYKTPVADVQACMAAVDQTKIQSIQLFDTYTGANVGDGNKSLAFTLTFASMEHTLAPDEIQRLQDGVIAALEQAGYLVRKG